MTANELTTTEVIGNVFDMIGKQWMLVGAEKKGKINAMTASWGGLGVMWGKNVAFVFIRETRYTKEFLFRFLGKRSGKCLDIWERYLEGMKIK